MAIERRGGLIILECDACDTTEESDKGDSFDDFWERLKAKGWTSKSLTGRVNGISQWVNLCPKCRNKG